MGRQGKAPHGKRKGAQLPAALLSPPKRRGASTTHQQVEEYDPGADVAQGGDDQDYGAGAAASMDVDSDDQRDMQQQHSDPEDAEDMEAAFLALSSDEDGHTDSDGDGAGGRGTTHFAGDPGAGPSAAAAAAAGAAGTAAAKGGRKRRSSNAAAQKADYSGLAGMLPAELDEEMLRAAWRTLCVKQRLHKDELLKQRRQQFPRWRFQLSQRFSLLFYGFGCKRRLLQAFATDALTDGGVVELNGHQAEVTSKVVLAATASLLTHRSFGGSSHLEMLAAITNEPRGRRVYVVLHNVDGPGLRTPEEQLWLSRLAQCRAVHLVASVDHANAALLWDRRSAMRFRWLWHDVTSYEQYEVETMDMPPLLTGCLQTAARRGAATVLPSLTSSARAVFRILAERQLDEPSAAGVSHAELYSMCRQRFLLSTEHALRAHLTEFRDHELVKTRAGADGGEVMYVPLEPDALQRGAG